MYIMSIIFGLIIVISSLFLIRSELNRAILKREQLLAHSRVYKDEDLFNLLENLQLSIDEMNNAFYEIAGDLEGKFSQHEKEIQIIEDQINTLMKASKSQVQSEKKENKAPLNILSHKETMDQNKSLSELEKQSQVDLMVDQETLELKSEVSLRDKIIKLRSEGVPLKTIAKEFNMGIGELQLLIQLPDVTKKT